MLETLIYISAVPLKVIKKSSLFMYYIHAAWITGAVPGGSYWIWNTSCRFHLRSDHPRKSIQQISLYCNPTACSSLCQTQ